MTDAIELNAVSKSFGNFKAVDALSLQVRAGELFAFPGIRESLGMVYLEAQSCGLPVVAFDNGGIPEVVAREETGFLVPMYDEKRFVAAVETLLSDPERRRRMGAAAAARVRRRHDLDRNYEIVQRVLERMVRAPA